MNRRTDPARRLALPVLLALLPTALVLWLLGLLLVSNETPETAPVISATLIPDEQPSSAAIIEEPVEAPLPPEPAPPEPAPKLATAPKPAVPTVVSVTPQPDAPADSGDTAADVPTVNWWLEIDRLIESQRAQSAKELAKRAPLLPPAIPNEPAFDPNVPWYNGFGEKVRDISENCRAEQRDPLPNDGFVPPPLIFCKRPPALALPLRRPRYLDNEITNDKQSDKLTRYAFSAGKDLLQQ